MAKSCLIFACDAAASLRNGPSVARCPNLTVAAASSHFLDAKHLHIRVYARIYAYMSAYTRICSHMQLGGGATRSMNWLRGQATKSTKWLRGQVTRSTNWLRGQVTRSLGHGRHTPDGRDWLWLWLSQCHDHPRLTSIRWGDVVLGRKNDLVR